METTASASHRRSAAIVIVNYRSAPKAIRCLRSLEATRLGLELGDDLDVSVTVVENASGDGSHRMFEESRGEFSFPLEIIESDVNGGFGAGSNLAIRRLLRRGSPPDYILLLNPDVVVGINFLSLMVETMERNVRAAAVGPLIYFWDGGGPESRTKRVWFAGGFVLWVGGVRGVHTGLGEEDRGQFGRQPYRTMFVTGACCLMRREAVERIGTLEEDYFLYYEDVDWCLRAQGEGWQCWVEPRAHVWHEGSVSTKAGSASYVYYHVRNGFVLGWRQGCRFCVTVWGVVQGAKQLFKIAVFSAVVRARPAERTWARAALRGLRDAWRGRMGRAPFE